MRLQCLTHVPFEGIGVIGDWAGSHGFACGITKVFAGENLPACEEFDLLVVMGGPMSVHDERDQPWLLAEKKLIDSAISQGKRLLGVCLGAQLIADVMGAPVAKNPHREIGWFPVRTVELTPAPSLFRSFPKVFDVLHWHGETFGIPAGARRIHGSDACENQSFEFDGRIVGLQYHLEMRRVDAEALAANCGEETAAGGPFVQSASSILGGESRFRNANSMMTMLLDKMVDAV